MVVLCESLLSHYETTDRKDTEWVPMAIFQNGSF